MPTTSMPGRRRRRLRTSFGVSVAVAGLIAASATAAVAAGSLATDLSTTLNGTQKSLTLVGELAGGTAQTHPVDLQITGGGNEASTWQITGASTDTSDVTASMAAVSLSNAGETKTGTISWTTPASLADDATYTLRMAFTATGGTSTLSTNGATVDLTFTVSGTGAGDVDTDADDDGIDEADDNCPDAANPGQEDADHDGTGNVCDRNAYAPIVAAAADDTTGNEGSQQSTGGTFTDADPDAIMTITKVGTGAGTVTDNGNGTWTWTHTPTDNGNGTVQVQANDGEHTTVDEFTWTATNVAPSVSGISVGSGTGTACLIGNDVTLDFGFSDPGVNDGPWGVVVAWGDGSPDTTYAATAQGAQSQLTHSYGVGTFTIGVTVTDKDNGSGTGNSIPGAVAHRWNMSGILAPFNADGTSVWKQGSTIPVKVKVTDCDANPVSGLELRVGTQLLSSASPTESIAETASTSAADSTGVMRYDATAGQYIYNFASKYLTDGNAKYMMYVRNAIVTGQSDSGTPAAGQSYQKFGLKTK